MCAAKNSKKRYAASSPAVATIAGTALGPEPGVDGNSEGSNGVRLGMG
jgi:hypothetical protein